jgi:hypothetical protein
MCDKIESRHTKLRARGEPSHPIAGDPDLVKRFRSAGSNEIRAHGQRNYFRRAPNQPSRRNDQPGNDTIFALPRQIPETGLEHGRRIDLRNRFYE